MTNINIIESITALYKLCTKHTADIASYFTGASMMHHLVKELDNYEFESENLEQIVVYFCFFMCTACESEVIVELNIVPKKYIEKFEEFKELYLQRNNFGLMYDNLYSYFDYHKITCKKFTELALILPTQPDYLYTDPLFSIQEIEKFIKDPNSSKFINNCIFNVRNAGIKIFFNKFKNYIPNKYPELKTDYSKIYYHKISKYRLSDIKPSINYEYTNGSTCIVYKTNEYITKKINKWAELNSSMKELIFCMNLDHPNIGKISNAYYKNHDLYFVMEYYGKTLANINMKTINNDRKHILCTELINGLNYIHKSNIVHRDLSIWNICYNHFDTRIIDFSSSCLFSEHTSNYDLVCISNYRPFDVHMGNTLHLPSFDVWSLGCVIYYIHTGLELFNYDPDDNIVIENILFKLGGPNNIRDKIYKKYKKMESGYWNIHTNYDLSKFNYIKKILKFDPSTRPRLDSIYDLLPF